MDYTPDQHAVWKLLYTRMLPRWERSASPAFLEGLDKLALEPDRIPELWDINSRLAPLTGFRAVEVERYMPAVEFFEHLRSREFPTVTTIRSLEQIDYLPEPDIFHDVAGHVPLHTCPVFADTLASFGRLAAEHHANDIITERLARFFWFTIEFGLIETPQGLRAFGSGLLSSFAELEFALESPLVTHRPFDLEEILSTPFEMDRFQRRLFVLSDFEQLYDAVQRLHLEFSPLGFRQEKYQPRTEQKVARVQHQRPA